MNQIRLHVRDYSGSDAKKRRQYQADLDAAQRIEQFLNAQRNPDEPNMMTYFEIA